MNYRKQGKVEEWAFALILLGIVCGILWAMGVDWSEVVRRLANLL